jgi:biopolymer transport protein ExbD/DNA-directed RNA polymerase subunit RPC12/RpoP
MIRFNCHQCGKKFKAPEAMVGKTVTCGKCQAKLIVPLPAFRDSPETASSDKAAGESEPFTLKTPKKLVFEDLVDMTAMVDIVFFLLIFFMVTSMQGLYSTISLPPPSPEKSTAKVKKTVTDFENDQEFVIVRIDRDNAMFIGDDKIQSEHELRVKLREAKQGSKGVPPAKKLMVLGHVDANTVTAVGVIDAGNEAGMDEVQLALDEAGD